MSTQYTVVSDWDVPQTLIEKDLGLPADHIVAGTVIELPDADAADLVASGVLAPVAAPVEGPFSITIQWAEGAADADIAAAQAFVAELSTEVNSDTEDVPAVIQSITITRIAAAA